MLQLCDAVGRETSSPRTEVQYKPQDLLSIDFIAHSLPPWVRGVAQRWCDCAVWCRSQSIYEATCGSDAECNGADIQLNCL